MTFKEYLETPEGQFISLVHLMKTKVPVERQGFYRSSEPKAPTVKLLVGKATERSEGDCLPAL